MPSWDAVGLQPPYHLAALAVACGVVALIFRVRLAAALSNLRKMYCDAGWEAYVDDEGRTYYYNELSGVTTWERPGCVPVACRQLAMVAARVARLAMAAAAWAVELFKRCAGAPLRKAWDATYAHRFEKLHEESDAEVAADATTDAADIEANAVNNGDQGDDPDAAPEEQEEVDEAPAEPVKKPKYEKPSGPPKQTKRGSVLALGVGQRSKVRGAASMFESGAIAERQEKEREEREKETRRASLSAATAESPAGAPAASEDGAAKEKEEEKTETKVESGEDAGADANAEGAPASEAIADAPAAAPAASDE